MGTFISAEVAPLHPAWLHVGFCAVPALSLLQAGHPVALPSCFTGMFQLPQLLVLYYVLRLDSSQWTERANFELRYSVSSPSLTVNRVCSSAQKLAHSRLSTNLCLFLCLFLMKYDYLEKRSTYFSQSLRNFMCLLSPPEEELWVYMGQMCEWVEPCSVYIRPLITMWLICLKAKGMFIQGLSMFLQLQKPFIYLSRTFLVPVLEF